MNSIPMVDEARGNLVVSMAEPRGSDPGFQCPVLIVSANTFNESNIQTVIVAIINSNMRLIVNISQIVTLDKSFFSEKMSRISSKQLYSLDIGI